MPPKRDIVASGVSTQGGAIVRADQSPARPFLNKPTKLLNEHKFWERFQIPNGVFIRLVEGGPVSTENDGDHTICFTKEQFNAGLRLPLPSLFK